MLRYFILFMTLLAAKSASANDPGMMWKETSLKKRDCVRDITDGSVHGAGDTIASDNIYTCDGPPGYKLVFIDMGASEPESNHISIDLRVPDSEFPANLDYIASYGKYAKWLVSRDEEKPLALILNVARIFDEDAGSKSDDIAVYKIVGDESCMVARFTAGKGQTEKAEQAALVARGKRCIEG